MNYVAQNNKMMVIISITFMERIKTIISIQRVILVHNQNLTIKMKRIKTIKMMYKLMSLRIIKRQLGTQQTSNYQKETYPYKNTIDRGIDQKAINITM